MDNELVGPVRRPSLADALVPLVLLAVLIGGALALVGLDALDGPIQVPLLLCCAVAALIAMMNGHSLTAVQEASRGAIASVTSAVFCYGSPVLSVLYGFTGFRVERIEPTPLQESP